ncbi:helix-turn-helix domain-containing protein [Salimicrobium halophilum]|uniref:DNA-binding transcriptional regulator, XRE-family HTH domain n=1 Tax=Salimicrobium halophilum TaxID=86666 RepID=A0A1G8SFC9_9BACI|nr:helix-turn-helix transcriptional regulator [Salimicrobium halophilum]SDJ27390.1 DNA-binding transcriptional regulator, XRE-family HTH domain [Salimicrobium halophilum]
MEYPDALLIIRHNIYILRLEKRWSQEKLAFAADIFRSYTGSIERGETGPNTFVYFKIVKALEVNLETIMKGT